MAQLKVGSSGWKSTTHRVVSGTPPVALENPEDRVPPTLSRTHNYIRSPRCATSGQWNNVGRGSWQNEPKTTRKGLASRVGHEGSSPKLVCYRQTARAVPVVRMGCSVLLGDGLGTAALAVFPECQTVDLELVQIKGI